MIQLSVHFKHLAPSVPNMIKALAMSPSSLEMYIEMMQSMYAHLTLPQSLISIICFTVAQKSDCTYCTAANEVNCRALGVDEATLTTIAENLGELNPERIRTIIEFAVKTAKYPQSLVPADYENLRKQGVSNDEIVQIMHVVGLAVYADILTDALKVEVDPALLEALGR